MSYSAKHFLVTLFFILLLFVAFIVTQLASVRVYHDGRCGAQEWIRYVLWVDASERDYDEFGVAERWRRAHKKECEHIWLPGPMTGADGSGYWPPLQYSIATARDIDRIRDIIRTDPASVQSKDRLGRTALHWAAIYPDLQKRTMLTALLKEAGGDQSARDDDGLTPDDWASQYMQSAQQSDGKP